MDESFEQLVKVERLLENLITMIGRSNRRLTDLSKRVSQVEQYIVEAASSETPFPDACYTFIARVEKPTPNS
ncbi:hypothetical protein [Bacillus sp. 1NLA3E]|uniref:hypothetical protein n=1 Tax=Bacillus sp. 1NLA3E TaxID=666686 RepID=UPI000247E482|nr:hypothetical protein [Bacillus sp. 1NLA3E]AGK55969.1 hypothetical protein B1NLA3E_21155 [Bacillus sp. 1NLA3E]